MSTTLSTSRDSNRRTATSDLPGTRISNLAWSVKATVLSPNSIGPTLDEHWPAARLQRS